MAHQGPQAGHLQAAPVDGLGDVVVQELRCGGWPRLPLPASILAVVTIYADPRPMDAYTPGDPVEVLRIPIIIDVEDIIGDALYPRPIL